MNISIKSLNNKLEKFDGFIFASDSKLFYKENNIIKVKIDFEDFYKCKNYGWYVSKKGYIYTMIDNHTIFLHRFILQDKNIENNVIDHDDGNKLNNCRNNLIIMTNSNNLKKAWHHQKLYNTKKRIAMYDKFDYDYKNIIEVFDSEKDAEKYLIKNGYKNARQGTISLAINNPYGNRNTAYGKRWKELERGDYY